MSGADPLFVGDPRTPCCACAAIGSRKKDCARCCGTGLEPASLRDAWRGCASFLVCGGPSVNDVDYCRLAERGVASLAINNVAGYVPVRAWTFGDHQRKFHHGLFLDPSIMTFAPLGKLKKGVRAKLGDRFRATGIRLRDCPNTWGLSRSSRFDPEAFFSTHWAHWGQSKHPQWKLDTMLLGLRLLHWLGSRRVYLLGVDLDRPSRQEGYCFAQSGSGGMRKYMKLNNMLRALRPVFDRHGFHVLNCNPKSRCDAFGFISFDEALADCKRGVPDEPWDLTDWYSQGLAAEHEQRWPESVDPRSPQRTPPCAETVG